jgi:hypothetical protein
VHRNWQRQASSVVLAISLQCIDGPTAKGALTKVVQDRVIRWPPPHGK